MPSRRRNQVDPLQLRPGDFVVHEQHGVGRFVEMMQRTVAGRHPRVPRHRVRPEQARPAGRPPLRAHRPARPGDQVRRRRGADASTRWAAPTGPRRSRGPSATSSRSPPTSSGSTARARRPRGTPSRPTPRGSASSRRPSPTSRRPTSCSSIDEVKADMEKQVPMDRLICGDVGYGKTEIAVRAAFKAIQDGKQVAVLVPTTLLVSQHHQTFAERYAQFPVKVESLSRFQSDKEAKDVVGRPRRRHASTSSSARTGCSPRTCRSRTSASSSSTRSSASASSTRSCSRRCAPPSTCCRCRPRPIPRTLEMAVTGIREMSTLATPPEERHPVLTFVGAYDEKQITAAIRRELLREGQVFFVHNKVSSIEKAALPPARARARGAHRDGPRPDGRAQARAGRRGLLGEALRRARLHDDRRDRARHLATPTPSSSSAPTCSASRQLHQLRGRVGRGRERAYAYFLYPPEKPMTETAHDRLRTIASNTDLGSGMAGRDEGPRDPRRRQPARRRAVRATSRASASTSTCGSSARRSPTSAARRPTCPAEIKIELPVDAHLPHDYVPGERLRLEAYKKLATVESDEARRRDRGRAARPLRRAARAGARTSSRSPGCGSSPGRPASATSGCRARSCASARSRTCARASSCASCGSTPGTHRQGGARHDPRAGPDDGPGRRQAAARRRGARVGPAAHHGRAARRHRRRAHAGVSAGRSGAP